MRREVTVMVRRIREWFSIRLAKNPGQIVLLSILLFNIAFFFLSAFVISKMSLSGTEELGFLESAFYTISMILDAGCISYVVADIGPQNAAIAIVCLLIVIIGMISFTGAVIGYITNYISSFIEASNAGNHKLLMSGHFVILNWNSRALEIVNDLLYSDNAKKVVVLVGSGKADIEKQIDERLHETVKRENNKIEEDAHGKSFFARKIYCAKHKFKNNLTIVVREGDVFSSKQLFDISLHHASSIVILGEEINNSVCKYAVNEKAEKYDNGNSLTIKTLMQVSDITSAAYSEDNQRIIVEITDEWTWNLVQKIIRSKQVDGKCNIVPVRVNQILGKLMAQFSLMPELNSIYNELLSNKGATFYTSPCSESDEMAYIRKTLDSSSHVIPLTVQSDNGRNFCYYMALNEKDSSKKSSDRLSGIPIRLNKDFWLEKKKIIMLGHNSKCHEIMDGFASFLSEWSYKDSDELLLNIVVMIVVPIGLLIWNGYFALYGRLSRTVGFAGFMFFFIMIAGLPAFSYSLTNFVYRLRVVKRREYIAYHAVVRGMRDNRLTIFYKSKISVFKYSNCVGMSQKDVHDTPGIIIFIPDEAYFFPDEIHQTSKQ